jgi:arylsulfatase A-like enzyme
MIAAMDEAIGQIVAAIDDRGWRKDTLIIFSSDNGGPAPGRVTSNGPLRAGKGTLYEGGVRVCAFATWEGRINANTVVNQPLHMVDWYPTLLKLAGAPLEQKLPLDGRDAWPTIAEGKPSPHEEILLNTTPVNGAIRVGDWKLVLNGSRRDMGDGDDPAGGGDESSRLVELFNLADDPGEKNNLAKQNAAKVTELRDRYDALSRQAAAPKNAPAPRGFKAPVVWGQVD